jgi:hypothetical protein
MADEGVSQATARRFVWGDGEVKVKKSIGDTKAPTGSKVSTGTPSPALPPTKGQPPP